MLIPRYLYQSCLVLSPALLLSAGCASTPGGGGSPPPQVIAHRGASAYAPENTLAAFRLAHEMGAPWYELDVMLTRDGELAVIHDNDLERTSNGTGTVWESDWAYLKTLDAGSWFSPDFAGEPIPTLAESLDMAKRKIGVYVEIKSSDDDDALVEKLYEISQGQESLSDSLSTALMQAIEESRTRNLELTRKCIALIREKKMQDEVVIQSFSPVVCFLALREAPDIRTEFLGSDHEDEPERWRNFVDFGLLINVAGFNVHHESLSPERLAFFHSHGKTVAVWTVDEPEDMRCLTDWGVDGIITNKPDVCLGLKVN